MTQLRSANLDWSQPDTPAASDFGDIYYSVDNGLAETEHVFLQHNQLPDAWRDRPHFCIAETGFGTGLNFLATLQCWQKNRDQNQHLTFISVEKYPLLQADLQRALSNWPSLHNHAQHLIDHYPPLLPGLHCIEFAECNARLLLFFGEAVDGFRALKQTRNRSTSTTHNRSVDCWFLDGFAPAKNPDMWSEALFNEMADLSTASASFATFTAAGVVKRGLKAAGFTVEKVAGFGRKREMLKGRYSGGDKKQEPRSPRHHNANWAAQSANPTPPRHVAVIGGGIAGLTSAAKLAQAGVAVTVFERQAELATAGSGNPQGLVYGKLSHQHSVQAEFVSSSLHFAAQFYQPILEVVGDTAGNICGLLQLSDEKQLARLFGPLSDSPHFAQALDSDAASSIAGIDIKQPAIFMPKGAWLHPASICRILANQNNIKITTNTTINALQHRDNDWFLTDQHNHTYGPFDKVVIACAQHANQLAQSSHLPLKPIRGQVTYLPSNAQSQKLRTAICHDGYIPPEHNGTHCIGASFDLQKQDCDVTTADHQYNLLQLANHLPGLIDADSDDIATQAATVAGRAAMRCTTPDYLPLVGPLAQTDDFLNRYAALRFDAKAELPDTPVYYPGLYVNLGFGSKGLAYAPLCAALLAAQIFGRPYPVSNDVARALNPNRFVIRQIIRGEIA